MEVTKLHALENGLLSGELTEGDYWATYAAIFKNRVRLAEESCDGGGFGSIHKGELPEDRQKIIAKIVQKGRRAR